jgi:lipopolysaccharide/colanic/teichoic acid biosynthesis glycosyltransferase
MIRRVVDVGVSVSLLLLTSPLLAAVALANYIGTRRILFRQTRIGRGLEPFTIIKFQTMVDGANKGSSVTVGGDARVTPIGQLLRAFKLDELPQLFNVLRGDMSLVGPRPLTPNEVDAIPRQLARQVYATRPGMTGIASLAFIDEEHVLASSADPQQAYFDVVLPQKVALEIDYAKRRTWMTDLAILVVTPLGGAAGLRERIVNWCAPSWAQAGLGKSSRPARSLEDEEYAQ